MDRDADGIVWLTLDKPGGSTNVLSREVLEELGRLLEPLAGAPPRGVVVRSGKSSGFIAGADIREFTTLENAEQGFELARGGQLVLDRLESLRCPTVAALHGFALGGGLELALACRYRIAVEDDRLSLGLPEVQLGIHPGFGGTVRSVRLLGVRPAMRIMLTGRPVRADRALSIGLVDRLVPAADLTAAARECVLHPPPRGGAPLLERVLNLPPIRPLIKPALVRQVASKAPREHYPAPYALIELWARYGARGEAAFVAEARSIAQLFGTETAHQLVRVFLLQDRLKSLAGKSAPNIRRVHVIGAGVMGGDIAAWCALRGFEVTLQDRAAEFIEPALARAAELFEKRVRDPAQRTAARERLRADIAGDGVPAADVVIEAIFESLNAKRELYASLEPRMRADALLATNTSSLELAPLAAKLARPERLVGLHFFNPVAQMPLIEVVQSEGTDPAMVAAGLAFARRLDKLPVPCRSAPGFVVNRVLMPYLQEAMRSGEEGVPLTRIDATAVRFGMPMGPIELADVVGLDVAHDVGEIIAAELGRQAPDLTRLKQLVAAKKLGRKSGEGFYRWQDGKPVKPDAASSAPPSPDLEDRLILALVNECAAVLREGVVTDADLLDGAVIFGTGFAPFRGGPLAYARSRGIATVTRRLAELAERYGPRFAPDAGWAEMERSGSRFEGRDGLTAGGTGGKA
ncbi:MAG TPA: 3-hydroxyacyl-CoA dehydrogenase NAD-binding domain-containing protein [Steroidobacteraceae bacterium]|nr:3-hydroxyacyl-CoA dehydrogenase NAD-binding domain-containing protein [Steroidobacteraceae bacterium]